MIAHSGTIVVALALLSAIPALGAPLVKRAEFDVSPTRAGAVARALVGGLGSIETQPDSAFITRSTLYTQDEPPRGAAANDIDELADELEVLQQVSTTNGTPAGSLDRRGVVVGRRISAALARVNMRHLDLKERALAERDVAVALIA